MLVVTLCVAGGCAIAESTKQEQGLVDRFHEHLNRQAYGAIYGESDALYRDAASEAKSLRLFSAVHRKLGDEVSATVTGWRVNVTPQGTFVVLGYKTTFRQGDAVETFTFHRNGDASDLAGYNINSEALITN